MFETRPSDPGGATKVERCQMDTLFYTYIIDIIYSDKILIKYTYWLLQTFGTIQGTFGPIQGTFGPIQGTFGTISGNIWPHSGNIWPHSGNIWPHSGNIWPHSGNIWHHSGNIWPHSGNIWHHFREHLAPFREHLAPFQGTFGPFQGTFGTISGNIWHHSGNICHHWGDMMTCSCIARPLVCSLNRTCQTRETNLSICAEVEVNDARYALEPAYCDVWPHLSPLDQRFNCFMGILSTLTHIQVFVRQY
jgi:hypothetical protein